MTAFSSLRNNLQYATKQQVALGLTSDNWLRFLDALGVPENSDKFGGFGGFGGANNACSGIYQVDNVNLK